MICVPIISGSTGVVFGLTLLEGLKLVELNVVRKEPLDVVVIAVGTPLTTSGTKLDVVIIVGEVKTELVVIIARDTLLEPVLKLVVIKLDVVLDVVGLVVGTILVLVVVLVAAKLDVALVDRTQLR